MKTWNTPVISELNISETANGLLCSEKETRFWYNDDKKVTPPEEEHS